jgi:hypothetical protein
MYIMHRSEIALRKTYFLQYLEKNICSAVIGFMKHKHAALTRKVQEHLFQLNGAKSTVLKN